MKTTIAKNALININIIVDDIEKAAQDWAALLGIEVPEVRLSHLEGGEWYTYRGKPVSCDVKVVNIPMEGFMLELHQPVNGDSTFKEFYEKHGCGVHHIGFEVGDARDSLLKEMQEEGYDTDRTLRIYPSSSWTIIDAEDRLGVNLCIKPVR